jgi:exodeoxyribonuclease VII large subunit
MEVKDNIFKVSEFNEFINLYLGQVGEVTIEGEIAEIRVRDNKWIFATIKDENSSVDIFAITYQISGYSIFEPGMLVHIYGQPRLYQKTGRFSVFANKIVPAGEGALRVAFEKLKEKLESEGLFSQDRKRKIKDFPERIGLITAKGSAAYGDFLKVLRARMGGIKIYFYPVLVQGKDSVDSIIRAFDYFNQKLPDLDALVLVRGGGSLEDLQSFNDEKLARAIFSSKIPVVCGVGHEQDLTIADLVADLRASTPSNAAELLVRKRNEVWREVFHLTRILESSLNHLLWELKGDLGRKISVLERAISNRIYVAARVKDRILSQFYLLSSTLSDLSKERVYLTKRISRSLLYLMVSEKEKFNSLVRHFSSFDIKRVLARGFSLTFGEDGKVIRSIQSVNQDSLITTNLVDGKISSKVLKLRGYE